VKIADDEGVNPSSSVIIRVSCNMFSSRVMYNIFSKTAPNLKKKVNLIYLRKWDK
jgi:hypothetical protein